VHEILAIDAKIRNLVSKKAPTDDIYTYLKETGKLKMLQTSLRKLVIEQKTTIQELLKLTYYVE
ncbi:MAG: hypothetical protein ACRCW1_00155, partial [Anaerotignaceae bacterium]